MNDRNRLALWVVGFIATYILAWTCHSATYYAATNGLAGNDGLTTQTPKTITAALSMGESNTIIVMPGTWSGSQVTVPYPGTTLRSQSKWQAKFLNSSLYGISTWSNNVTVDGFEIAYAVKGGVWTTGSNSVIRNCWIHHCATNTGRVGSGIGATQDILGTPNLMRDLLIENNLIEYNGAADQINTDHGVYICGTNIVVRGNVCRYNVCAGIQIWDHGIGSTNVQIYNNLCYGNGSYGLVIGSESTGNAFVNVFGNTFVGNRYAIGLGSGGLTTITCTNNIVIGTNHTVNKFGGAYSISGDYNLMNEEYNLPLGAHGILTNYAGFVNTNSGLYWLKSDTAARGRALSTVAAPVDFFGNVQSSVADVGAFQFSALRAADSRILDPSPASGADYWMQTLPPPANLRVVPISWSFGMLDDVSNYVFSVYTSSTPMPSGVIVTNVIGTTACALALERPSDQYVYVIASDPRSNPTNYVAESEPSNIIRIRVLGNGTLKVNP